MVGPGQPERSNSWARLEVYPTHSYARGSSLPLHRNGLLRQDEVKGGTHEETTSDIGDSGPSKRSVGE